MKHRAICIKKTYVTISRENQGKVIDLVLSEKLQSNLIRLLGFRWLLLFFPILVTASSVLSHFHHKHVSQERIDNHTTLIALSQSMDSLNSLVNEIKQGDDFVRKVIGYQLINDDIFTAGIGGNVDPSEQLELMYNPQLKIEHDIKGTIHAIGNRLELLQTSRYKVQDGLLKKLKNISHTPSILPADGRLTSGYGNRLHPILKVRKQHKGIDISNKTNTDIKSAANGQIIRAQYSKSYGNFVEVSHDDSITTLYAHMKSINVQVGDKVFRGQVIGKMGNTGRSTGTHLHYEVRKRGHAINPKYYFLPENKVYD